MVSSYAASTSKYAEEWKQVLRLALKNGGDPNALDPESDIYTGSAVHEAVKMLNDTDHYPHAPEVLAILEAAATGRE